MPWLSIEFPHNVSNQSGEMAVIDFKERCDFG